MKKTLSFLLALLAVASLNLQAFALQADTAQPNSEIVTELEEHTAESKSALSLSADEDSGIKAEGLLTPNQTLRFPILLEGKALSDDQLESKRLRVETKDGRSAVSAIKIVEDGSSYALEVKTLSGYPSKQTSYEGQLKLLDKTNGKVLHSLELSFSVGYNSVSDEAVEEAKDGSFLFVDAAAPIITEKQFQQIDRELNGDKLTISGKGWTYEVRISEQPSVNMLHNERSIKEIVKQFEDQSFKFLSFPAGPVFDFTGTLTIDVSDVIDGYEDIHAYSYYNGKLNKVWATLNEEDESLSFKTKYFGRFVITDKEIKNGTVIHCDDNSVTPSQPSQGKPNPETGAGSQPAAMAAAMATLSASAAGIVVSKKIRK